MAVVSRPARRASSGVAWTTPHTWVTSETVTGALLNTNIRDNTSFLYQPPGASLTLVSGSGFSLDTSGSYVQLDAVPVVLWDTDTMSDASTFQLTVNTAGVYMVCGHGEWDQDSGGKARRLAITWNSARHSAHCIQVNGSSALMETNVTGTIKAVRGDVLQLAAQQDSGDTINLTPLTNGHEVFTAVWCGSG